MKLWTLSLREAQRHRGRTLLTLLGIALGLAVVVATRLTIDTARRAYCDLSDGAGGPPALTVTAPGLSGFDAAFTPTLEHIPGVRVVCPRVEGVVAVSGSNGSVSVRLLGIDLQREAWPLCEGCPLHSADDAQISPDLARALDVKPGQSLRLWAATGPAELRLVGVLRPGAPAAALGGLLVVPLETARRLFGLPERVNRLEITLQPGAEPAAVRAAVVRQLPPGLVVDAPVAREGMAGATLDSTEQGLTCLGAIALTAAAFVILNTFLLSHGQRRRQYAILRTLGATRAQLTRLLLREALLLGLAGALAGCAAGAALSGILLHAVGQFLGVALPAPHWSAGPFLLAALLGPGIALAVAFVPAWCAARRQPLQELAARRGPTDELLPSWAQRAGLLLLIVGVTLGLGVCRGCFPPPLATTLLAPALALLLAGATLAVPLAVGPLLRLAQWLPLGLEASLACRQLVRHRGRTGLTAGVLFLALAVAVGFGHAIQGIVYDLQRWYRRTVVADFLVRGSMTDTTFALAAALPEALADEVVQVKGVAAVERLVFQPAAADGQSVLVLARSFAPGSRLPLDLREGSEADVRTGLLRGEVVLGTALAGRLNLHAGDTLTLTTPHGPGRLRVAGTAAEYAAGGQTLYLEWAAAQRLLGLSGVHVFLVSAAPGSVDALGAALRSFCAQRHLLLQSNAELSTLVDGLAARAAGVLWALMAMMFVVASLGVFNTLAMNVHDQAREFGVLRALGLKRGQLRTLVRAQALLLFSVSVLPGIVTGLVLAYVLGQANVAWGGPPLQFRFDAVVIAVGCGLALVTALLAAVLPARSAAQASVVQSLRS